MLMYHLKVISKKTHKKNVSHLILSKTVALDKV
jgi:hypothetical protein